MLTMHESVLPRGAQPPFAAHPGARPGAEQHFDPVIRAVMACDGVGRDKTIALVLSAVEAAFPS